VSERRRSEERLRQSAAMSRAVLDSMHAAIAVLDARGEIVEVNAGWKRCAEGTGARELCAGGVGDDYVGICRAAAAAGRPGAQRCADTLVAMLREKRAQADVEYSSGVASQSPLLMRVVALATPPGGLVVAHIDLSAPSVAARSSGSSDVAR
jgi:hypothetical protein